MTSSVITQCLPMRTIIDLPESQLAALRELEQRKKLSRAELIRRAVAQYVRENAATDDAFGAWRAEGRARIDGVELQRALREEWTQE